MANEKLPDKIKRAAIKLGFDAVGIAPAVPAPHGDFFRQWLANGRHAQMGYLQVGSEPRTDLLSRYPWAKTIVSVATSYNVEPPRSQGFRIARYAAGDDYHKLLEKRLQSLLNFVARAYKEPIKEIRYYVDTGPILEREYAQLAGVGWIGKNTNVISKELGSYLFLAQILTPIDMPTDPPATDHCGTCTECITACPTDALLEPYTLDANRCIAYLNVEKRGDFTPEQSAMLGDHLFGCDICQEVCPWNNDAPPAREKRFRARPQYAKLSLESIAQMDERDFSKIFSGSAIKRAKHAGLARNARAVLENKKEND